LPDLNYTELIPDSTTREDIQDRIIERIQTRWPDWEPSDAQLETWLIEELAGQISDLYQVMGDIAAEWAMYFGETILNLPRNEALNATADSTWTMAGGGTYTVPEGTQVGIANGLDLVTFETAAETTISGTGTIPLRATEAGTQANNLDGTVTLIDPLAYVDQVTLDAPTAGGIDAETMDQYLPRLVELLQLMSPRPILPRHFEVLARQYGAYRAVAIEGLDPDEDTTGNALTMTVAVMDEEGQPLDTGTSTAYGTKTFIQTQFEQQLMANSVLHIIDPDYTTIDVTATVVSLDGYDHATVTAAVQAALTGYFTPINWGRREGTGQVPTTWVNTTTVRYLEIAEQINRVPGVDYIDTLTFKKTGGSLGTADITLDGYVPLTEPGTISIA
jgi:hypothetical protein